MKHPGPHYYRRVRMGKDKKYVVFRCILPNCSHYVPKELAIGRQAVCWKCHRPSRRAVALPSSVSDLLEWTSTSS